MSNPNLDTVSSMVANRDSKTAFSRVVLLNAGILIQTACLFAAFLLQNHSRKLADPYTNIYSDVHTWLFIASMGLWNICVVLCVVMLANGQRLPKLAWPWLLCSGMYFGWFLSNALGFFATLLWTCLDPSVFA